MLEHRLASHGNTLVDLEDKVLVEVVEFLVKFVSQDMEDLVVGLLGLVQNFAEAR